MKLSTFAIIITILAIGFGLAFVFVPVKLAAFYGISLQGGGILMARYFGAANLFLGMIFWSYSSVSPAAKSWPKLLLYSLIYDIIQLIITLPTVLNKEANSMGWTTVALFALLAIGSAYFMVQCNKARAKSI
ncbi:MAG TPA: hypothetical protein VGM63_04000 [Mucilaginibacter sp.]|jgi:hypothetical protein